MSCDPWLRLFLTLLVFTIDEAAGLANELLLTLGTGNGHVGLVDSHMGLFSAWLKRSAAGFTDEWLFAKAALDHDALCSLSSVPIGQGIHKGLVELPGRHDGDGTGF